MPNVVSASKRTYTYCEDRKVFTWLQSVADERAQGDVSVILREITLAAYASDRLGATSSSALFSALQKSKAAARKKTREQIRSGELTPAQAQKRNSLVNGPVRVMDLWPALRRHTRNL